MGKKGKGSDGRGRKAEKGVMPPPAVTLTFDLLIPKYNLYICEPINISAVYASAVQNPGPTTVYLDVATEVIQLGFLGQNASS